MSRNNMTVKAVAKDCKMSDNHLAAIVSLGMTDVVDVVTYGGERFAQAPLDIEGFVTLLKSKDDSLEDSEIVRNIMSRFLFVCKAGANKAGESIISVKGEDGATAESKKEKCVEEMYNNLATFHKLIILDGHKLPVSFVAKLEGVLTRSSSLHPDAKKLTTAPYTTVSTAKKVSIENGVDMMIGEEPIVSVGKVPQVLMAIQRMVLAICAAGQGESINSANSECGFVRVRGVDLCLNAGYAEWSLAIWDFLEAAIRK